MVRRPPGRTSSDASGSRQRRGAAPRRRGRSRTSSAGSGPPRSPRRAGFVRGREKEPSTTVLWSAHSDGCHTTAGALGEPLTPTVVPGAPASTERMAYSPIRIRARNPLMASPMPTAPRPASAASPSSSGRTCQPPLISERSAPRRYVTGLYVAMAENHPVSRCLGDDGVGEEEQREEDDEARVDRRGIPGPEGHGVRESP